MALLSCAGAFGAVTASWTPNRRYSMRYLPFSESFTVSNMTQQTSIFVGVMGNTLINQANLVGVVEGSLTT
jgi:hypothetical protein